MSLNVVDSSGWLEYFVNSDRAKLFANAIQNEADLIVPVISIYEVFKKTFRERGENEALQVASAMQSGNIVDLDVSLALEAGKLGLPLADSIIYATAVRFGATLWTQDMHFEKLPGVRFFAA